MMRRIIVLVAICAVSFVAVQAGKNPKDLKAVPLRFETVSDPSTHSNIGSYIRGLDNAAALNWVLVDSMSNAFGPASNQTTPLVFDPGTGALAVLHRGVPTYGLSGALYYNVSLDGGSSWRRVGEISTGQTANLRYPSLNLRNPRNLADTAEVWATYAAPNLRNPTGGGSFGGITYGIDPFGQNAAFSDFDDGPSSLFEFASNLSIWNATGADSTIFWATRRGGGSNEWYLWRTSDYTAVTRGTPPTWVNANFTNPFSYIGGTYRNGKSYFNVISIFAGDSVNVENFGYSSSTDGGAIWSAWTRPPGDWATATGLGYFYDLVSFYRGTGNFASYSVEAAIDANDRAHYFTVVADSPWTLQAPRSLLEVYQTASGWSHKWITQAMNENTGLMYPGIAGDADVLDQTYNAINPSISPDGQVMTLTWLDAASPTSADTMPDIWFSYRRIDAANWSAPVNLTQTPGFSELLLHTAPVLRSNGGNSYTLFLGRSYQTGINTYPPNNAAKTSFYVASHTFTVSDVAEPGQPASFTLDQNYPNPFNPNTTIRYSVAQAGRVSLKVFNTLGQEVATLVDGNVAPGEYQATFDASKLSSGVYIYKMTSGSLVESRKMLLLK